MALSRAHTPTKAQQSLKLNPIQSAPMVNEDQCIIPYDKSVNVNNKQKTPYLTMTIIKKIP